MANLNLRCIGQRWRIQRCYRNNEEVQMSSVAYETEGSDLLMRPIDNASVADAQFLKGRREGKVGSRAM